MEPVTTADLMQYISTIVFPIVACCVMFYLYDKTLRDWDLVQLGEWIHDDSGWWYRHPDGSYTVDDWERIDGNWYYFDDTGYVTGGWIEWNGDWYYLHDEHDGRFGEMYESTCAQIDGEIGD